MANQIKDFESKIRKYHSLPEAIVIDCKRIGYPFYVLYLDVTYLVQRELELLEEFVMKCIDNGLNKLEKIASFLGMDNNVVEKTLSELISKDLIKKEDIFKLTEKGSDALKQQKELAPVSDTKTFYLDALSGKLMDYFYLSKFDSKNNQNTSIGKIIKKPRKDHVEDIISYFEDIEKYLQNPNNPHVELIQVNRIEKVYPEWHEISLVLYKSNPKDQEIEYEIFSRDSIQKDYRETIEKIYAEGKKILDPIFQDIKQDNTTNESFNKIVESINDEDVRNVEQISIKISSLSDPDSFIETQNDSVKKEKSKLEQQLKEIKNQTRISEVVHTYEIREYLLKALKEAKNRVMIVSPWIKGNVVNQQFISTLEDSLKRKVKVYIIYGIKGSSFQNDNWSIKKLENLSDNYRNLKFEKTKNSHRKQIVCDDKFAIVTSFNFLSFRADPNLTYRDELGVVLRDKQTIEDLFNSGLGLIRSAE
ncbi:unknown [Crocosphaera subtropica ATCC 51142]|uniref:Phospholipase D-like domain-containing protein n=1 Tax=Crocosphaera subtropica (strain ATCC 51142 / BH68) TaxID=43989 RepID=B1WR20_CROS5|nr:phospholipase D-like domain-containing protein [Crocosphaera subtropica]ACB50078.1 unknown [Crocosphaera subtropica ATCC 51142]